jgi:hypothetical protein
MLSRHACTSSQNTSTRAGTSNNTSVAVLVVYLSLSQRGWRRKVYPA